MDAGRINADGSSILNTIKSKRDAGLQQNKAERRRGWSDHSKYLLKPDSKRRQVLEGFRTTHIHLCVAILSSSDLCFVEITPQVVIESPLRLLGFIENIQS